MNKEALKLEPYLKYTYKDKGYKIRCHGRGEHTPWYCITREMFEIDDLELVLMSCLNSSYYKDLEKSPIKKYWAYLYDYDYFGIIDRDWNRFDVKIYVYNEDGSYTIMEPPRFEKLFDSSEEFEQYLKEEFDKMERYSDEEGELLQPWELDEAREVLAQDGWSELELEHLRWVGNDRGFAAPLNIEAEFLGLSIEEMIKNHPELYNEVKNYIKYVPNLIKLAHDVEESIGCNGPEGFCGVYIYRVPEGMEVSEDSYLVTMPDGRRYILHEGD
jgi:hypothetical protein|nr:MAG TPA: hypothetical protein [Bacteriophage sp.]